MNPERAFRDQIAVVTGAGSGIARAIALCLAAQGAMVCLVGRRMEALEGVAEHARAATREPRCYAVDLTRDEQIQALASRLEGELPHVDVLVHGAGVISLGRVEDASAAEFDRQYRTNVRAPYLLTQALLGRLRSRQGQVVFLNSSLGLRARSSVGPYAASKHALKALADALRDEVNAEGIRVLSVFLGRTASPMQRAIHAEEGMAYHPERLIQPEDVAAMVLSALRLAKTAEVTDIAIRPFKKLD